MISLFRIDYLNEWRDPKWCFFSSCHERGTKKKSGSLTLRYPGTKKKFCQFNPKLSWGTGMKTHLRKRWIRHKLQWERGGSDDFALFILYMSTLVQLKSQKKRIYQRYLRELIFQRGLIFQRLLTRRRIWKLRGRNMKQWKRRMLFNPLLTRNTYNELNANLKCGTRN